MNKIKVALWGTGAMGQGIAKIVLEKKNLELVGGICQREEKDGKDLGEILGLGKLDIPIYVDPEKILNLKPHIIFHSTTSTVKGSYPQIIRALEHGINVITIAEEMAYPWYGNEELANKIDETAKKNRVRVIGTGVNPGFVLDTLIILLTSVCQKVESIWARRVNDLSPYGPTVLRTQGVGTTEEQFYQGLKNGSIVGHVGFPQSICLIAKALNWRIDEIKEERKPIISKTERETKYIKIRPGEVAGCNHLAWGFIKGKAVIILEHPQQIVPQKEGIETGDYIKIEGTPSINLQIKPEIAGGIATEAISVNIIPSFLSLSYGLHTMLDLPLPHFYSEGE